MPTDGPPAGDPSADGPRGADLARQVLAQAKRDARERARGRRPVVEGRGDRGAAGPGSAAPLAGSLDESAGAGGVGDTDHPGRSGGPGGLGLAGSGRRRPEGDDDQPARRPQLPGIARPGRQWREPVAFGAAVTRLLAARGWRDQAADASVLSRWDVIVGPDIAEHCTPASLRDGHLELVAESTAWATQMRMLSTQILATLRRELGPQVVQRITVRGPTAPSWKHGPIRTSGRGPRDTYG
ncbi:putative RNA-binding protein containing Zn ribbon [Frankia sp. AiPs1]|uniref:DUF721 domain-containing protein n=1 Tax=Frankia sp. AiPa1 TaxID=573492 RepID=UPI00202AF129|nr:DciA family protein [Frankia sp. AiPa1]MCL9760716.1 DciA family protein [Frankia sp. AiPa1]